MGKWVFGYLLFLVGLFAVCSVSMGLKTTLWSFGVVHLGCTLLVLGLWWQDERHWGQSGTTEASVYEPDSHVLPDTFQSSLRSQAQPTSSVRLSGTDEDFDLIASYTEVLTKRVSSVYPLVAQEHIRQIVWTVLLELCGKPGVEFRETQTVSDANTKIPRVA